MKRRIKSWSKLWQFRFLLCSALICSVAPVLMNHQPLVLVNRAGDMSFPAFGASEIYGTSDDSSFCIHAPVPYSPVKSDLMNAGFKSPFDQQFELDEHGKKTAIKWYRRHWFGTDLRGGDILSYSVFGLRNSFLISLIALLISMLLGFGLGFVAGWRVNNPLRITVPVFFVLVGWLVLVMHGVLNLYSHIDKVIYLSAISILAWTMIYYLRRLNLDRKVKIRFDFFSDRVSEIFIAVPRMILLLVLVQYFEKSILSLALIIGLTGWVDLARLIRSETIRLREQPFVDAARMTGQGVQSDVCVSHFSEYFGRL